MIQALLDGLIQGVTLALVALAFVVVYRPTGVFHVALGGVYVLAPYVSSALLDARFPWSVAVLAAVVACAGVSVLLEVANHSPLRRRNAAPGVHLVSSLGAMIVLTQIASLVWGNDTRVLREGQDHVIPLGPFLLTGAQIIAGFTSTALLLVLFAWLSVTSIGLQLRALAENSTELALRGVNVQRLRIGCFGLSGVLCSSAALLSAYDTGFSPHGGVPALLLGVVAAIVGGQGSFVGPVIGALLLGVLRVEVAWLFSSRWQEAFSFLLLALFLFVRSRRFVGWRSSSELGS